MHAHRRGGLAGGEATSLHTSGVSQALAALLFDAWAAAAADGAGGDGGGAGVDGGDAGLDGFDAHVGELCDFYRAQRDAFLSSAARHLGGAAPARAGGGALARWVPPADGM